MKNFTTFLFSVFLMTMAAQTPDLDIELFASGLNSPINIKHAGDDQLYVVEQSGTIKIINSDGTVESTSFLDISSNVTSGGESGLLGLAFHPNYSANGYFFVNYINNSGDTVISRFTRDSGNPQIADPNSELMILTYNQPASNHNGGELAFGPDGYLYISSGDGGGAGDTGNNAQSLDTYLGKLLRIDIDNVSGGNNYSIPADNPFISNPNALDEIWAYGLRNPWKFSFDKSTNDLWIADVGQSAREEINFTLSTDMGGLNYGWRCYEGNETYNTSDCPDPSTLTFPVSEYAHTSGRCSITGGYRYRGTEFSNFNGTYFFADYCTGEIGTLTFDGSSWNMTLEDFNGNWAAFGEDNNGEIYAANISNGNIYKLIDANALGVASKDLEKIAIYPNPSSQELNLDFNNYITPIRSILILDLQGKIIKTIKRNTDPIQKVNVRDIATGIYIIKIENENGDKLTRKLAIN